MWSAIKQHFSRYPAQEKVARLLLRLGMSVKKSNILCGEIKVPEIRISRALGIDRRAIKATIKTIEKTDELRKVFENIQPTAFFKGVAPAMGWGLVEIHVEDPSATGILAGVSKAIADEGISIRQAVSEDPELTEDAKLLIITEQAIPSKLIPRMKVVRGVKSVVVG